MIKKATAPLKTTAWRETMRVNSRKTYFIIATFFLIYISVGLLIDTYYYSWHYHAAYLREIFVALLTLEFIPYATMIMSAIAAISLWLTFMLHDRLMLLGTNYHKVTEDNAKTVQEQQLYNVVEEMKVAAGMRYMPRVYIIDANYMNAFASGYSEKSAMIAITRGLIEKLNREELQAVMAHELTHIRHLDIKITLVAAVLSNLTLMALDLLFYNVLFSNRSDRRGGNQLLWIIMLLRYLLPIITVLLMLYLSRTREYMADAGAVELMRDNKPLVNALLKIQGDHKQHSAAYKREYLKTPHENVRREAYIFDPVQAGIEPVLSLCDMFSTHPDIRHRLKALGVEID